MIWSYVKLAKYGSKILISCHEQQQQKQRVINFTVSIFNTNKPQQTRVGVHNNFPVTCD